MPFSWTLWTGTHPLGGGAENQGGEKLMAEACRSLLGLSRWLVTSRTHLGKLFKRVSQEKAGSAE